MTTVPGWKRTLLAAYNPTVWWLRRRRGELAGLARGRVVRCSCCGRRGPTRLDDRAVPLKLAELWGLSEPLRAAFVRKETSFCFWCGANLRSRRIATALLEEWPVPGSLADWRRSSLGRGLRIAEINLVPGVHEALGVVPGVAFSDFGATDGRSEDLMALSYPEGAFDLVVTSETLEHVPDLDVGLAEVRRVLRPGGRHVFTVPWRPDVPETFARARIGEDGRVEDLEPPIKHPGGDWGHPVFTEIGTDFPERLRRAGFSVETKFGPISMDDVAQVFVARKGP